MGRLFAGTPWDRPPACDLCGKLESECACPPPVVEPVRTPPEKQTARVLTEKRAKGKLVTVVRGLEDVGGHLDELAARLKARCGAGGAVKDGEIAIQGDHRDEVETILKSLGYRTRR